jgi:hypothetical protein
MALTVEQQPYNWTARGQKIVFRVSSTETTQPNFKYGVEVTVASTGKIYSFLLDPNPNDLKLYFDMTSLVQLQNMETGSEGTIAHYTPVETIVDETSGFGFENYSVIFSEWWQVTGTLSPAGDETMPYSFYVFNAYIQPFYGFRPAPETSSPPTRYTLSSNTDFAWSDRWLQTSTPPPQLSFPFATSQLIFIPAYNSDYGAIACQTGKAVMASNGADKAVFGMNTGTSFLSWEVALGNRIFAHVGCYPMNLNDSSNPSVAKPSVYTNWQWYSLEFQTTAGLQRSRKYIFYNADKFGQHDCKYNKVRLGWVSMRGGWDYFTFIKRNEWTNNIERKQYVRVIENGTSTIFDPSQRQYVSRNNSVERILTLSSDWVEENEFIYLRNLFASRQVVMLAEPTVYGITYAPTKPIVVPVILQENSFVEQRGRNGKLVNVSLKIKVAQDFWT